MLAHSLFYLISVFVGYTITTRYSARMTKRLSRDQKNILSEYYSANHSRTLKGRLFYLLALALLILLLQRQHISFISTLSTQSVRAIWVCYLTLTAIMISTIQIGHGKHMHAAGLPSTYIKKSHRLSIISCCYILCIITIFFGYLSP